MSRHMDQRTTVRLPEQLLKQAKRKAAAEGRTLTSLIEDGLRLVVIDRPPAGRGPKGTLPISDAKGGARPGIDLSNSAQLQELDDLDYVERLKRGFK